MRRSIEADRHNQEIARNYTYVQRTATLRLNPDGSVKRREVRTYDVTLSEGTPYQRLIAIDDKPLPPDMERREREKLEKSLEDRRKETPGERAKRVADWEKKQQKNREFTRELLQAMDFRVVGDEPIRDRKAWIVEAVPHPGYEARSREARFLAKVRGKLWVDQRDYLTARIEAEFTDDISFGAFLAKLYKGSRFEYDQVPVNGEVWLPSRMIASFGARVVFARIRQSFDVGFKDYRKFQADSRIIVEDAAPPAP